MTDLAGQPHIEGGQSRHAVVETPEFLHGAKGLLSDSERTALVNHVASHPTDGVIMEGTGGARKFRWAALGKGKRGGCRVVSFYAGPDLPVFLLAVFGKGDKANLSKAERNELRDILTELARRYREGMRR